MHELTETRHLPVQLSEARRLALLEELAENVTEKDRLVEIKKELASNHSKAIAKRETTIKEVSETLRLNHEHQKVSVKIAKDLDKGRYLVTRLDNGAVVEDRALTQAEREAMTGESPPGTNDGRGGKGKSKG